MFSKLKQFKDLRDQAKTIQGALAQESVNEEKNGVKVTLNGNMEVTDISLNESLNTKEQAEAVKSCMNSALKQAQRLMAKKMQDMGGFPGLK